MSFCFDGYEERRPPEPVPHSPRREPLYQFLAVVNLVLGRWYIWWRWPSSLNWDALWFAVSLALAETPAWIGLILFTVNLWKARDYPLCPPPASIRDCVDEPGIPDRPVAVDVFFTTFDEEVPLVRSGGWAGQGILQVAYNTTPGIFSAPGRRYGAALRPRGRSQTDAALFDKEAGEDRWFKRRLNLTCSWRPLDGLSLRKTAYAHPDGGDQQPWNPDYTFSVAYRLTEAVILRYASHSGIGGERRARPRQVRIAYDLPF